VTQIPAELDALIALFTEHDVRSYLEVGCKRGETFDRVVRSTPKYTPAHCIALDMPGGPWGKAGTDDVLFACCMRLYVEGWMADCLFGDSQDAEIIKKARDLGPYDAVLIDADHRYDAVLIDWRNYGPMGRLVAFHDIAAPEGHTSAKTGYPVEVPRLWAEIKASGRRTVEFVAPGSLMGIGVVLPEG
jgi:hypothetical protein